MKKVLLLVLGVFSLGVANAQFRNVDGNKARTQVSFNNTRSYVNGTDTILVANVWDTTTTLNGAGYLITADSDTSLFYHKDDTARLFTTALSWLITPALPCCTPDTVPLYNITTQCTTVTANRWSPVIVDSFGNVSTTVCDTISYLYVDSLASGIFNLNGNPYEVLYFDSNGNLTSDSSFTRNENLTIIGYENDTTRYNAGIIIDRQNRTIEIFSNSDTIINGQSNIGVNKQEAYIKWTRLDTTSIVKASSKGISFVILNDSIVGEFQYVFPNDTPKIGQSITATSIGGTGIYNLEWGNQTLSGSDTLDFGSISPNSFLDLTITVVGAELSDPIALGIPESSVTAEVEFSARVSAPDTVTVRAQNVNGGNPDPASGLFKVKVFK